ncbi:MAG: hypothetical protein OEM60_15370 [Gammaproteobacteria bacterium]|nr:hypothetical protein [Gammaproteobacteria bacterium]MDH3430377.1 hypothetical protein [Gammaproteobacteria bacterium]MDH3435243.1 hypothetical protein [Gammaproteobacteria bacterium]
MSQKNTIQSAVVALTLLTTAAPAHAYLDPSTASMAISAIVGLFATASLAIKTFWYKLKSVGRRHEGKHPDRDAECGDSSSSNMERTADH